jgi:hypothetical protein
VPFPNRRPSTFGAAPEVCPSGETHPIISPRALRTRHRSRDFHIMPEILYHYTTAGGLFGILQHKSIWATDARFLNDAQEIIYALDDTCEYLRERLSGEPSGTPQHAVIGTAIEMLKEPDLPTEIYLSCFCEDGDLLSQWRGYAAGQGYAIGFDAQQLAAAHAFYHNHPQKVQLIPVTYGLEQERERLREIISSVDLGSLTCETQAPIISSCGTSCRFWRASSIPASGKNRNGGWCVCRTSASAQMFSSGRPISL